MSDTRLTWYPVIDEGDLPDGRVCTVAAGEKAVCLTRWKGAFTALDNRCPHQGGPLGEGSIENGWLRCPWHGWDYDPSSGRPPGGYDDGVPVLPSKVEGGKVWVAVEERITTARTVSDGMVDTMVDWGVRHVFGMVGHSNLGLAEAIRRRCATGDLHYVGVRHEGAAAFAASAYGKLTGRPAACLTIAGPGATNLLTGIWDAKVDRSPVLALTGQVATQYLGPGDFQECDLEAAFKPATGFSKTVLNAKNANDLMALALKHAITRREPTHLIFPDEVQVLPEASPARPAPFQGRVPDFAIEPPEEALARAVAALRGAKRPVLILGHGARSAAPRILAFAERLDVPIVTTFKAKGVVADSHPLACGVLGRSGTPVGSWFMNESDVLLVLGASFSKHTGITTHKTLVQVDVDPMNLSKFHPVDVPVWGDIERTLARLDEAFPDAVSRGSAGEVAARWKIWRDEKRKRAKDDRGLGLPAAFIFQQVSAAIPESAVVAVDVGNNTYSFGRYFESKGQPVLMSGYLGSIGFGLPAAIGAWAAVGHEGRKVVAICGDGGLGQYLADLTTAVKYGMDITVLVLDNGQLGKISKEQRAGDFPVWETSLVNPDFAAYADLCGARGFRVEARKDLKLALDAAMDHKGPSLVCIRQDPQLI